MTAIRKTITVTTIEQITPASVLAETAAAFAQQISAADFPHVSTKRDAAYRAHIALGGLLAQLGIEHDNMDLLRRIKQHIGA